LPVNHPSEAEKQKILKKIEQDDTYSHKINQLSDEEKQRLLDAPSMLVLMLQLSEGKPFDLIIEDVVMRLPDDKECPARQVFGVLCSFYRFGIVVPGEILELCLPNIEKRYIDRLIHRALKEKGDLAGLVGRQQMLGYEGLTTIHEIIAEETIHLEYNSNKSNYPYSFYDL
jgi:hypothetical protein